jgi:diguanylate cyclase (GGDEF)-like protein
MHLLLKYTLLVEPDRQRLSHFVLYAVEALGGNVFKAVTMMSECMSVLYEVKASTDQALDIEFILDNKNLILEFEGKTFRICELPNLPVLDEVSAVATRLSQQSELASPELLRQRNAKITEDLERAMQNANEELAQLEVILESRRLELERVQKTAETDSLTGLYNHGAYDQRMEKSLAKCLRQGEPLCLMMLDLDKFKEVNDTYGHVYGDQYLKKMATSMREACRTEVDVCCRLGGDEFAVIVFSAPSTTKRIAKTILEKMEMRVSIGIAQALPGDTPISLTERCDKELYKAKEKGRGQIVASHITVVRHNKSK